jgi:deoxyribodipyrimidine photo-lyase
MSIVIFNHRRDLRLSDNLTLFRSLSLKNIVIPVFFFDPNQIVKNNYNKNYFSPKSAFFIIQSVLDLQKQYQDIGSNLLILYDKPYKCLELIIKTIKKKYEDDIIFAYNLDFSKYSLIRDEKLNKIASNHDVTIINDTEHSDYCLNEWSAMVKDDTGYKQYGAFYKNALKTKPTDPISYKNLYKYFITQKMFTELFKNIEFKKFNSIMDEKLMIIAEGNDLLQESSNISSLSAYNKSHDQWLNAGRKKCLKRIRNGINNLKKYNDDRNLLSYKTSNISAYLNMGTVSIREIYSFFKQNIGSNTELIKQLYWRDFYLTAVKYLPKANEYSHMDDRYNKIKWHSGLPDSSQKHKQMDVYWKLLLNSKTGFLLIDAGMQELKNSGFLHGRNRMIVGMFWTKYLLIDPFDPKYGSQVGFSKLLVDAIGPSQNKMNHHWITEFDFPGKKFSPSTSKIAGRPMSVDNMQIKKVDPECIYIKKWLPHLENVDKKDLYNWSEEIAIKYGNIHPTPIFDSKEKYKEWIELCKN